MAKVKEDEVKDFDYVQRTIEEHNNAIRMYMERYNTNSVQIAGTVREKREGSAKPKIDKKTNEHILLDGVPQFWEPFLSVTVAFEGGEIDINLDRKMYEDAEVSSRYLFEGTKGLNYGRVQDKFHSMTKL